MLPPLNPLKNTWNTFQSYIRTVLYGRPTGSTRDIASYREAQSYYQYCNIAKGQITSFLSKRGIEMLKFKPLKVYRRALHFEKHNEILYIDIGYAPIFLKLWM
jgi:hypothetical protein